MTAAARRIDASTLESARKLAPDILRPALWRRLAGPAITFACLVALAWMCVSVDLTPAALARGFDKLGNFLAAMVPPRANGQEIRILEALAATFAMAVAGTVLAVVAAIPLGLIGAQTIVSQPVVHFLVRRTYDAFRTVPTLVWALVLIVAFGLGPIAGVMALALADAPRLAKYYAEAIENADPRPQEGIAATGGGRIERLRLGLAPEVLPVMASQTLYTLEGNFRNAAILGVVGAGGIGLELEERIRIFAFDQVAWIVIAYVICVMVLDVASEALRRRLVSG